MKVSDSIGSLPSLPSALGSSTAADPVATDVYTRPPGASDMFAHGNKASLAEQARSLNLFTDHRYSRIDGDSGGTAIYDVTQPFKLGTFGRVRLGRKRDDGTWCVDKESISGAAAAAKLEIQEATGKKLKTCPVMPERATLEFTLMQAVEPELKLLDTFDTADKKGNHGKLHAMMPWMPGDGDELVRRTRTSPFRVVICRAMLLQILHSLKRCHALGYAHHDLKLANILWNKHGRFFLSDFGKALPLIGGKTVGGLGTWFAPEQLAEVVGAKDNVLTPAWYDARIDVWGLGMACLQFHAPWHTSPFIKINEAYADKALPADARLAKMRAVFASYALWRETLCDADGRVDVTRIDADAQAPADGLNWNVYFAQARSVDAELLTAILQSMLVPKAAERASIDALVEALQGGVPSEGSDMDKAWREALAKVGGPTPGVHAQFLNLASLGKPSPPLPKAVGKLFAEGS